MFQHEDYHAYLRFYRVDGINNIVWFSAFDEVMKRKKKSLVVGIILYFMSQFSCQLVSAIIVSTSKAIDTKCKLESPPKHFDTSLCSFVTFWSWFFLLCHLCFPPLLIKIQKDINLLCKWSTYCLNLVFIIFARRVLFIYWATFRANSMQLEEISTIASLILIRMLKSKSILWLWNFLDSSSLVRSSLSTSPFICMLVFLVSN